MCGIAGVYGYAGEAQHAGAAVVHDMISTLAHRGPDAAGVWRDPQGRCVLGHRRLSIIDTSDAGRQPMASASGAWMVSFNGEIYNFEDLRRELAGAGVAVRGRTDTEVLLESLALWGADALPKLDGMFAFAAFNTRTGELLLARDPFGEKPLYYMETPGGGLAFASELQALQRVPRFDPEVSPDAMAEVLMFQYIGAPRTIYRSVRKLPPAHWLSVRPGEQLRIGRYYEFLPGTGAFDRRPIAELADELEDILVRSIRRRLIADVPLGAFLSGGVDSSTVCALVRRKLGLPLKTFSIGFEGASESEHEAARLFARHLGTEHFDQVLEPDTSAFLAHIGMLLDEPNADSSCMPTYLLSRFAREHVTVALSGDGGDEMFAGYGRYFLTLDEAAARAPSHPGRSYYSDRILVSTEKHVEELFGGMPEGLAAHLARLRGEVDQPTPPLYCRLRKTDVDNYLPGAVLPKVDRMSMQHSLEVRTPFLNVELARFAERLPLDVLYRNGRGKLLLREIAYRYLPRELVDAPKRGFGIPMSRWGREPLLKVASELLESEDSRLRAALGTHAIERFMKRQRSMGGFATYQVWGIAMLESWLRHHPAKVPELASSARGKPARPAPLYAWPLATGLFAVTSDEDSLAVWSSADREDDMGDASAPATTLRMALVAGSDPTRSGHDEMPRPLRVSGIGAELLAGMPAARLVGATILFPERAHASELDAVALRRLLRLGVKQALLVHPYRYDGTLISLALRHKSSLKQLADAMRLYRMRVARLKAKRRDGATAEVYESDPLPIAVNGSEPEASGRYMLYHGASQLPPVPASHEDIERRGGGRYSVWRDRAVFAPSNAPAILARPYYWLVENNPRTEPYLDMVPALVHRETRPVSAWHEALEELVATRHRAPGNADRLRKGDTVVVLTQALPPGGAERQWCYLAHGLKQAGHDVVFAVMQRLSGASAHYLPWLRERGIEVREISAQSVEDVYTHRPTYALAADLLYPNANPLHLNLDLLASFLCAVQPRAVFAQLDPVNLVAGVAALLADVPKVVLSFRNYNPTHFSYLNKDWFLPVYRALAGSGRVVLSGNSRAGNESYASWMGVDADRIALVPNAIDVAAYGTPDVEALAALRAELGIDERGRPVILGVFRLSEEKKPLDFVDVCARVAERFPDLVALLVGVGPLADEIDRHIAERGLQAKVKCLGRRGDVRELMALSSLLLLTSSHEGTPNVVMEAQAVGLPVVATDSGGTPDLVENGRTGYLRPVGDVDGLAARCSDVLIDPDRARAMAQAARSAIVERFSIDEMTHAYLRLLEEARQPVHEVTS